MKRTVFPTALFAVAITALLAGAVASLSSTAAFADEDYCKVPKSEWKTTDELKAMVEKRQKVYTSKAKLTGEGWDVRKIKEDEGCFEVYAIDSDGKKIEAYFEPASFVIVKQDGEDD